jgi:transposase
MAAAKNYSDVRESATRRVLESGRLIAHVAQDLGVHKEALRTWGRHAKAGRCRWHRDGALQR